MRFFLISLFALFLLSSCSLALIKELTETKKTTLVVKNPYFADANKDYIYKANIEVYGHHIGGMLIIKKIKEKHHRVVLSTEIGKAFDFEFIDEVFKKNYVFEDMDKAIIINTLEKDFKLLLKEDNSVLKQYADVEYDVYQSQQEKRYNFYFTNKETKELRKIVNTSKSKEKVEVLFVEVQDNLAKKVQLDHKNIKLKIDLKYIGN